MFVNGDAVSIVMEMLLVGSLLLGLALVAHVVWLRRLASSHALASFGPAARIALLVLAAATPLVSFYGVEAARRLRRLTVNGGSAGPARTALGWMGALAALLAGSLVVTQLLRPLPGPHGSDLLARLPGMILVLAAPCAVLGMAGQVLVRSSPARMAWLAVAGIAAVCLLMLG